MACCHLKSYSGIVDIETVMTSKRGDQGAVFESLFLASGGDPARNNPKDNMVDAYIFLFTQRPGRLSKASCSVLLSDQESKFIFQTLTAVRFFLLELKLCTF